jgi:hypothetical protein
MLQGTGKFSVNARANYCRSKFAKIRRIRSILAQIGAKSAWHGASSGAAVRAVLSPTKGKRANSDFQADAAA